MIKSFSPFLSVESSYDGRIVRYVFKCVCGSESCVKLDDLDKFEFYSGSYMCSKCGRSVVNGEELLYYHDCFKRLYEPVQLSLF